MVAVWCYQQCEDENWGLEIIYKDGSRWEMFLFKLLHDRKSLEKCVKRRRNYKSLQATNHTRKSAVASGFQVDTSFLAAK
jgi:hypothetical protein